VARKCSSKTGKSNSKGELTGSQNMFSSWHINLLRFSMKYAYEFYRDHLEILRIKLPGEIELFADFIEDISTEQKADEYITKVENVLNGLYQDFEIHLNATSVLIKKDMTVLEHLFTYEEPYENEMETEEFKELMIIWKSKIPERFKKNEK
jgi:hypothetical protein